MFKSETLDLTALIAVVERDLEGALWGLGRCRCGRCEGDFASTIYSADWENTAGWLVLTERGLVQPEPIGWMVTAHGSSPLEALTRAYGLALEKVA